MACKVARRSLCGIAYSYGGNTRQIAKLVQQETGGDLCEIEIATPYTGSYNDVVEQGQREVNSGFTPKLKPVSADLKNYDTVILGTPVWWYTYAPAMRTLLQSSDFSGKVIYPFATNGGWLGHTFADIAEACPTATVKAGLNIRFNEDRLVTPEAEDPAVGKGHFGEVKETLNKGSAIQNSVRQNPTSAAVCRGRVFNCGYAYKRITLPEFLPTISACRLRGVPRSRACSRCP